MTKPRVLVVADYYLPGFRAGGPVRAISNAIDRLASSADFFVVTRDHDCDGTKYSHIETGCWTTSAAGRVLYAPRLTPMLLRRCVQETACDVVWLNSLFSRGSIGVLTYRRLGWIRTPVLLAPRGECSPGALSLKPRRKAIAIRALQWSGCLQSVHWIASSGAERQDIARVIDPPHLTSVPESVAEVTSGDEPWPDKSSRQLKAVFAARIAPTKNLLFLLEVLARCTGRIHLDIVGPLEDPGYWARCRALLPRLPADVTVTYAGEASHRDLQQRLSTYDVMFLPTIGENFGHVIVEAWAAGCPVMVSDRTPWRGLMSRGLGWDLPLDHAAWAVAIDECLEMSAGPHLALRRRVREHARRVWREGVKGQSALRRLMEEAAAPRDVIDLVTRIAGAGDIDPCA